jgi:hypothetical protein
MLVIRDALEKAGKADREAVAEALHTMDGGPRNTIRAAASNSGRMVGVKAPA